jgi:hypothetical protein
MCELWADADRSDAINNLTAGLSIILSEITDETERFYIYQPRITVTAE